MLFEYSFNPRRNSLALGLAGSIMTIGLPILSLRRGANSKRGAYLKLGANSSIYGKSISRKSSKEKVS